MSKFKVNDKVRVIADEERLKGLCIGGLSLTGAIGPIKAAYGNSYDVGVKTEGGTWSFAEQDLELVENQQESQGTKFRVRETDDRCNTWTVADGPCCMSSHNYIQSDGTVGYCVTYPTEIAAQVALDLYLKSQQRTFVGHPDGELEVKETNPKDALGIKKASLHLVPCGPLFELSLAMLEGGRKYGAHNYRAMGVLYSVYYDAAMRHLMAWWEGEDIDGDSGIHHITKAMACLLVVRDSMLMGNAKDDRPIKHPDGLNLAVVNERVVKVLEKYPNCTPPFTEKSIDRDQPVPGGY